MPSSTLPRTKVFITNQCCKRPKLWNQYFKGPKYIKSRLQKAKIIKSIIQLTKIIKSMLQKTKDINIAKKRRSSLRKECFRSAANMYGCSLSTFCRGRSLYNVWIHYTDFFRVQFFSVVHKTREFLWHFICFDPQSVVLPIMYKKRGRGQEMWHSDWVVPNTNDDVMYEYFMIIVSIVCQKKYFLNFCAEMLKPFNFGQQIKTHL